MEQTLSCKLSLCPETPMRRAAITALVLFTIACGDKEGGFSGDGDTGTSGADGTGGGDGADGSTGDGADGGSDGTSELVDEDGDGWYDYQDCDDNDDQTYPGAEEVPYDGIDQDCNGFDLLDFDQDGFDSADYGGEDCDDDDASVYPGAEDVENGIDDDCDGELDEEFEVIPTDWPIRFGAGSPRPSTISIDSVTTAGDGTLVTFGLFEGEPDVAPTYDSVEYINPENGTPDLYIAAIDADRELVALGGVHVGATASAVAATAVADSTGILISGTFTGTLDFEVEPPEYTRESQGDEDGFVGRYTSAGGLVWAASLGGTGADTIHDAAIGTNHYAGGQYADQLDVWDAFSWTSVGGGGTTADPSTSVDLSGATGGFVAAWDADGLTEWAVGFSGASATDEAAVHAIDVYTSGTERLVAAGTFAGGIDLDPGEGESTATASGSTAAFVVGLNSAGEHQWSVALDGDFSPHDLAIDTSGTTMVAGALSGSVSLGGSTVTSAGGTDALLIFFDYSGNYEGHVLVGGAGDDAFTGVDMDGAGGHVVAGRFSGSVTVGGTTLTSNGGEDCMVARLTSMGGSVSWAYGFGGVGDEGCSDLTYGQGDGYVYFAGAMTGVVDFGTGGDTDRRRAYGIVDAWAHRLGL